MFENYKEALTELPYYMVLVVGLCAVILGLMRMLLSIPPPPPLTVTSGSNPPQNRH